MLNLVFQAENRNMELRITPIDKGELLVEVRQLNPTTKFQRAVIVLTKREVTQLKQFVELI